MEKKVKLMEVILLMMGLAFLSVGCDSPVSPSNQNVVNVTVGVGQ